MAALDAERQPPPGLGEADAPIHQVGNGAWPAAHERIDAIEMAEAGTGL